MIDHKRIREQVLNQIMEHPETHNQSSWSETCEKAYDKSVSPVEIIRSKGCGTNACIAGWAIYFATDEEMQEATFKSYFEYTDAVAADLLDLCEDEARTLFHYSNENEAYKILEELVNSQCLHLGYVFKLILTCLCSYSLSGESIYSNDQFDYVSVGGFIAIPRDFTDTKEAAKCILEEYTNWCNGHVYGVIVMERDDDDVWLEVDFFFGCIGVEFTENTIKEIVYE